MWNKLKDSDILIGPLQVAFDITNKCNFRCLHCYNNSGENNIIKNELSDDEVISLMHDLGEMKLQNLCFCGGEPLLRKKLICSSAKILKSYGVKSISLVTNGYLMTEEIAKDLIKSGINNFQVSLDGISSKSHDLLRQMEGSFDKAIDAIKILKNCGVKNIDVAFSCTNFNLEELKSVYYLCNELGVSKFRTQPLMIIGRATENEMKIALNTMEYRTYLKKIYELKDEYFNNEKLATIIDFGDPINDIIRGYTEEPLNDFITLKANGDIPVSPYIPMSVGNIRENSLKEYWNAGLSKIWEYSKIKEAGKNIISSTDFGTKSDDTPNVWMEDDLYIDLIKCRDMLQSDK